MGEPSDALCQVAGTVGADLIVVGNKRMQGATRILGSVPKRVVEHADCHVLVVRRPELQRFGPTTTVFWLTNSRMPRWLSSRP